jgi:hypothetical protein
MRSLYFILIGVGIGYFWYSTPPKVQTVPIITVTETLADFVIRESQALTAEERHKLIAITQKILAEHFDTSWAIREEFRFQRLKAGLDSPAFRNFSAKWESRLAEMNIDDTVESMRKSYRELLEGVRSQERQQTADDRRQDTSGCSASAAVCGLSSVDSLSGEPVEDTLSPSNVSSLVTPGQETEVSDEWRVTSDGEKESQATNHSPHHNEYGFLYGDNDDGFFDRLGLGK